MDMVEIPKEEYERLKRIEKEADLKDFEKHLRRSLKDAKEGRIIEY